MVAPRASTGGPRSLASLVRSGALSLCTTKRRYPRPEITPTDTVSANGCSKVLRRSRRPASNVSALSPNVSGDAAESERDRYVDAQTVIYNEVRRELQRLVFDDELGDRNYESDWAPDPSLHADEHGNATDDVTFIDVRTGSDDSDHDWFTDPDTGETRSRKDVVLEAFKAAAETLEARFGTTDPSTWLREEHKTVFTVLGAVQGEAIDMVKRATYQHAVEMRAGPEGSMDALPPSNSGHVTGPELAQFLAGVSDEPERVDDRLDLYANFEYKPHPVTREQVGFVVVTSETLMATSERPDLPAEFSRTTTNVLCQRLFTASDQGGDLVGSGDSSD